MPTTTQLSAEELAARKAAIAKQQATDTHDAIEADVALHRLADELHNEAFAKGGPSLPSFADSLRAAAVKLMAEAAKKPDFPPAALARLQLYAPAGAGANPSPDTDPINAAEEAVEHGS